MKTRYLRTMFPVAIGLGLVISASLALAQNSPALQLSSEVPQILQLEQAKVSDDTIIAYIKNSGRSYSLNADQIINLRQQGVSDAVITAMLNQPKLTAVAYTPTTPAPQPVAAPVSPPPVPTATIAPAVTYVQTVPAPVYYYQPYYYPACSPVYSSFPALSLSFAWGGGGGWHGGSGWHH